MKWVAIAFAALAASLVGALLVGGAHLQVVEPAQVEVPRAKVSQDALTLQAEEALPPKASPSRIAASRAVADEEEWKTTDLPAVVAARMYASKDKRAFFDQAMKMGGGAYLMMAREAYMLCRNVAMLGPVRAEQNVARRGGPQYAQQIAAHRALYGGCDGFHSKPVDSQEAWKRFAEVALQDDTAGRLHATMRRKWNAESHEEIAGQLRQYIDIGDPYLLERVGHRITIHRSGLDERVRMTADEDSRRMLDEAAWRWALCELGKDCSPQSPFGQSVCAARGVCEWRELDEIAEHIHHPLQLVPGVRERKDEIVAAVRARDWAKLGL
jgi:hypothetical protein